MPVEHLETYISKNIPEGVYEINLKDLIHGKTVLLEAGSVTFTVLKKLQNVSIFQPKTFKAGIEKYIDNILSCGAKVIIIMGYHHEFYSKFFKSQERKVHKTIESLENLKKNNDQNFKELYGLSKEYTNCGVNTLLTMKKDNFKILVSYESCQKMIIDYIRDKNDCPVVIIDNSDLLIYDETFLYVKAGYIDFETLNCFAYDKNKILKFFDLSSHEFPLFATLCGNKIIDMSSFHKKINTSRPLDKFQCVAKYIKKNQNLEGNVKNIVEEVKSKEITEELLMECLDMYQKNNFNIFNLPPIFEENKTLIFSTQICRIISNKRSKIFCSLENPKDGSTVSSILLFQSLRQKLYGILLDDDSNKIVKEHYFELESSSEYKIEPVKAVLPIPHPGLKSLWENRSDDANEVKRNFMLKTVSTNANLLGYMKDIHPSFFIPVLALYYLNNEIPEIIGKQYFKGDFEVKAFLIVALLIFKDDKNFNYNTYEMPNYRALDLSTKFKNCCELICLLNEACGFVIPKEKSCLCNYFDDLLFQKIYKKLEKDKKCDYFIKKNTSLNDFFNKYLRIVTGYKV